MSPAEAERAVADLPPPGRWAVAVSGGADSVALLELLASRRQRRCGGDLELVVAHLDHETRAGRSADDADFVDALAQQWSLPCVVARRSDVERLLADVPANRPARYRAARLTLFRKIIADEKLDGVVLAHHADDQAETIIQRLLRGSGAAGLVGIRADCVVSGVRVIRPLLAVPRSALREFLRARGTTWCEDATNALPDQQRNRVRTLLAAHPTLAAAAIELGGASAALVGWLRSAGPELGEVFDVRALQNVPPPVARESARRWLVARAGPDEEIPPAAADRLVDMACDAAAPARQHFPGGVLVRRRGGKIAAGPRA